MCVCHASCRTAGRPSWPQHLAPALRCAARWRGPTQLNWLSPVFASFIWVGVRLW